jgi:flagellar hook-basal body complex protein FliE
MDLSNVDKLGTKSKLSNLTSKPQASIEKSELSGEVQGSQELKQFEIEMEEADRAFALMTQIKEKLQKALEDPT